MFRHANVPAGSYPPSPNANEAGAVGPETPHALAVEVVIAWGSNPLRVEHLDPPRSFYIGRSDDDECDFVIEGPGLNRETLPLVLVDGNTIFVNAPIDAEGEVTMPGYLPRPWSDFVHSGVAARTDDAPHLARLALPFGAQARIEIAGMTFAASVIQGGDKPVAGAFAPDTTTLSYVGLSLLAHAGVFAGIAAFTPPLGLTESEDSFRDQMYLMSTYLEASAERERLQEDDDSAAGKSTDTASGGASRDPSPAPSSGGAPIVRSKASAPVAGRGGAPGADTPTRAELLEEARAGGMIAVLNTMSPVSSSSAWQGASMADTDDVSPVAWRGEIGDWAGTGLGLTGTGNVGDGFGSGPSIFGIGTVCQGDPSRCTGGPGGPGGFGHSHGQLQRPHTPGGGPTMRQADLTINGHIPREVIQRIVRQNYGRFRSCYESGLRNNPQLQGRVAVRFVIGRDGSVTQAMNGDSDMPDSSVVKCIVKSYYDLTFPSPEGGIVTVTYPILFNNGG